MGSPTTNKICVVGNWNQDSNTTRVSNIAQCLAAMICSGHPKADFIQYRNCTGQQMTTNAGKGAAKQLASARTATARWKVFLAGSLP